MATKPTDQYTYATAANFSSGPDSGNPTKANPPGYPAVAQGEVPGLKPVAAFTNKIRNITGQWIQWLVAGSSAGAADAHIVETDSNGDTAVQNLDINDAQILYPEPNANVAITVSKQPGTGANAGVALVVTGQPGQDQTGAVDNNNGGPVTIETGPRGVSGTGVTGDGFGGQALSGPIDRGFDGLNDTSRITEWAEGFDLAISASATKVMSIPIANDKTVYAVEATLASIESGAGTGLGYGIRKTIAAVKREGATLTISATTDIYEESTLTFPPNVITFTDGGSGMLDVKVAGSADATDGNVYVRILGSRVSV